MNGVVHFKNILEAREKIIVREFGIEKEKVEDVKEILERQDIVNGRNPLARNKAAG